MLPPQEESNAKTKGRYHDSPSSIIRVLIVDDHPMVAEGIQSICWKAMMRSKLVGTLSATDKKLSIRVNPNCQPDVILMDLNMPGLSVV